MLLIVIENDQRRLCQPERILDWGSVPGLGAGDRGLAITNFPAMELMKSVAASAPQPTRRGDSRPELGRSSQPPLPPALLLRRYAVGERIGVKIGVVTQTVPGTVLFARLRNAVFFARGKIIPRIVPRDSEERPVGAL